MSEQRYPYLIKMYKGENRYVIVPLVLHMGGYSVEQGTFYVLDENESDIVIGNIILEAINIIKNSPISYITPKERDLEAVWKKCSKYKGWNSFWKNNYYALLKFYEDGHYQVYSSERSRNRKGCWDECIETIELLENPSPREIGQAIITVFKASEEYHAQAPAFDPYPSKSLSLLDESTLVVKQPSDKHFQDVEDNGAAEIYQCYSYLSSEDAESSADFYVGIAPELDCNLSKKNIQNAWEELHGKADFFEVKVCEKGIFTLSAEMKNKNIHKKSYFLQMEEDLLLECSMDIYQPNRRKKLDEKLSVLFEEFALNCKK